MPADFRSRSRTSAAGRAGRWRSRGLSGGDRQTRAGHQEPAVVVVLWPRTNKDRLGRLAALMREIGLRRFLMGSDWPACATPGDYHKLLEVQLPLTRAEWVEVLGKHRARSGRRKAAPLGLNTQGRQPRTSIIDIRGAADCRGDRMVGVFGTICG